MINELISAIFSGIVTWFLEKRKERRADKKEKQDESKKIYAERPELKIIKYKNCIHRPGHKMKKKCDINVFMTRIENVSVQDATVIAHYNKDFFNKEEWCCVIYKFQNVGKTDISCISPICTYQKDTMLCDIDNVQMVLEHGFLDYSTMYDKKVRVGESFTMRICYHKDCIVTGLFSSIMVIDMEDSNHRFWEQSLFAPENKLYDTYGITYKDYKEKYLTDKAIECFKKPWLW